MCSIDTNHLVVRFSQEHWHASQDAGPDTDAERYPTASRRQPVTRFERWPSTIGRRVPTTASALKVRIAMIHELHTASSGTRGRGPGV